MCTKIGEGGICLNVLRKTMQSFPISCLRDWSRLFPNTMSKSWPDTTLRNNKYQYPAFSVIKGKCKAVLLQAWTGPEGSRKLRLTDFMTTAQDGGRFSALRTGRLYPKKCSWYSFLLEAESTPGPVCDRKDFMSMKHSNDTSWDRTSDLPICSTAP